MDSVSLVFAAGFRGSVAGTTASPGLEITSLTGVARTTAGGSGWQLYDAFAAPLTIAGAATTTLNLITGLTNPLGESITGAAAFAHVFGILIEHDAASLAVDGIEVFGGASLNLFQEPWSSAAKATLIPGRWVGCGVSASLTGLVVDGTHKNIDITNLHATLDATVNVMVLGKIT